MYWQRGNATSLPVVSINGKLERSLFGCSFFSNKLRVGPKGSPGQSGNFDQHVPSHRLGGAIGTGPEYDISLCEEKGRVVCFLRRISSYGRIKCNTRKMIRRS